MVDSSPLYFSEKSLKFLIKKLKKKFKIKLFQRYDLSNHLSWAINRKPGGMNSYTNILGQEIEEKYKLNLVKKRICDLLIGVIYK